MNYRKEIESDRWLEGQLELLQQIEAPRQVDVTEAVMRQIEARPLLVPQQTQRRLRLLKFASTAIAACFAGAAVVFFATSHSDLQAATTTNETLSSRLYDIYDFCNDYADTESVESAAYYDNPMTNFI